MASICATSFTVYTSFVVSGLLVGDLTALVQVTTSIVAGSESDCKDFFV